MPEPVVMDLTNTYPAQLIVIGLVLTAYGTRAITRAIAARQVVSSLKWAALGVAFTVLGYTLQPYGEFVSTTWPFPDIDDPTCCRSMNIYFGETTWWFAALMMLLGLSLLLLAAYKGLRELTELMRLHLKEEDQPDTRPYDQNRAIRQALLPTSIGAFFISLTLIPLGIMGLVQGKFTPPPFEWYYDLGKDGRETIFVSVGIYLALGVAGMLLALAFWLQRRLPGLAKLLQGLGWWLLVIGTICLAILTAFAIAGHVNLAELPPAPPA